MANTINNVKDVGTIIAKMAAATFDDNLAFCKSVQRADESDFNGKNGYKAGQSISISTPNVAIPTSSFDQTSTIADVKEGSVSLDLDVISSYAMKVDSLELATEIDVANFYNRLLEPAVKDVAHDFEYKILNKATQGIYNSVGTPASGVFDTDVILSAREKLGKYLCPKDSDRFFMHDSSASRAAVNARKGLFQKSDRIAEQYDQGYIGMADGFNWVESELVRNHTNGNDVTSVLTNGSTSEGVNTLNIDGLTTTTGTVTAGSVFTLGGVFAVHPLTKEVQPFLQQFTVVTGGTANGSGQLQITVSPALYASSSDSRQNISALPADGAALTFVGSASSVVKQNIAFHKRAFRLATVPLALPSNAEFAGRYNHKGINVAVVYDWDQIQRAMVLRLDVLGGIALERPEWATRVVG
jgi:hypothetical protein